MNMLIYSSLIFKIMKIKSLQLEVEKSQKPLNNMNFIAYLYIIYRLH